MHGLNLPFADLAMPAAFCETPRKPPVLPSRIEMV